MKSGSIQANYHPECTSTTCKVVNTGIRRKWYFYVEKQFWGTGSGEITEAKQNLKGSKLIAALFFITTLYYC